MPGKTKPAEKQEKVGGIELLPVDHALPVTDIQKKVNEIITAMKK